MSEFSNEHNSSHTTLIDQIVGLPDDEYRFIDGEWWVRSATIRAMVAARIHPVQTKHQS